ncbi:unnamed protein product [Fraxinus pennsylvanica]|uniref:Uncharacterized protein n=1 Tax=Fraxinus pennsylvanica TaxID=56036 RepID=A0AAD2DY77_9LAMI|nr:unnamed protein product [Fraxinus pennsylvanica]
MDEKEVSDSFIVISEENSDSLYPMFFGISCAFFALRLLPEPGICDDKWSEIRNRILQGSAHLLGLLVWRVRREEVESGKSKLLHKLKNAEKEIEELKKIRSEDAKANEKVVSIFAAHEQTWFNERKKLRQQIGSLVNELRVLEMKMDKTVSELNGKLQETEKQMLLDDVKLSKSRRKQLELETESWKAVSESRHERDSLRNMLSKHVHSKSNIQSCSKGAHSKATRVLDIGKPRSEKADFLSEYNQPKFRKGAEAFTPLFDPHSTDGSEEKMFSTNIQHLEYWVKSEAEKCKIEIEERHQVEIDAFAEQLRLKDEKIEAFRWRLLSMELESKRFQSHVEGLDHELAKIRQDNLKLEALLLNQEAELHTLREQLALLSNPPDFQKTKSLHEVAVSRDTVWSKVKIMKRKPGKKERETKMKPEAILQAVAIEADDETMENKHIKDIVLKLESPQMEIKEGEVAAFSEDIVNAETSTSIGQGISTKINPTWKVDLHALGVSYKIKRLKQQLLMLERLIGNQGSCEKGESNNNEQFGIKGFYALMSFLNKQVDRYQSLQGKADDICKRMHENALDFDSGSSKISRTEEETRKLEHFLEETFQLQRYIVATGQKLMEVQTKIASSFIGDIEEVEKPVSFDMKRFAETVRTLFREVQRGLEVRISRLIGDLEGTLACDCIIHFQNSAVL